jgi:hypothetical protein
MVYRIRGFRKMTNPIAESLNIFWEYKIGRVNTCLPGRIEGYDASKNKAEVQPLIQKKYDNDQLVTLPIIANVPVVFPRTATAGIFLPVARGDLVLLVFCQNSLDKWLVQGGIVDPEDRRKHDLNDAIAIPGLYPFNSEAIGNGEDLIIKAGESQFNIKKTGEVNIISNGVVNIKGTLINLN